MMETVALILAAIAGVFVLLIIAVNIYFKIRPNFRMGVNCWFCHESTSVPYDKRACWDCPFCEQYNGFSVDGGYNKPIPAQHDESLNKPVSVRGRAKEQQISPSSPTAGDNGLCIRCNTNQQLKIQQLASFSASDPSRYDDEVEEFQRKLERYYQLCASCEATLEKKLSKQASWMLGLKLDRLRKRALLEKDLLARRFGSLRPTVARSLLYTTTVLASWLLVSVAAYLVDPGHTRIPLPPGIHAVLRSTFPGLSDCVLLPAVVVDLLRGTLAWETHLTAGGGVVQLLAGLYQAQIPRVSRWVVVDILCVVLWAILHGLCWTTTWNEANTLISPWNMKVIHACSVLATLVGCLVAAFNPRRTVGTSVNILVGKKLAPASDGLDFSDAEEVEATPANCEGKYSSVSGHPPTKLHKGFPNVDTFNALNSTYSNVNYNNASSLNSNSENSKNKRCDSHDADSQLNSCPTYPVNNRLDSFKTFRTSHDTNSVLCNDQRIFRDSYKTKSRLVKSKFSPIRKSPNYISDMLNTSVGNISLPVEMLTPEKDNFNDDSSLNQLPTDIGDGLSNLKLGSPLKDVECRQRIGSEDGYMELFKGSTCRRRSVLSPSRFRPRTNVARSSWVAGGFWQAPRLSDTRSGTDILSPFSQTSSQSSGFASQSSQMPNSRSSSVSGGDYDVQSVTSENCGSGFCHRIPTPDGKVNSFNSMEHNSRPSLVYNMAGGFTYPRSVTSETGIDSTFNSNKNLIFPESEHQACFYHGNRTVSYPPPLFSPQPYYFQQAFPPQYLYNQPSAYGTRFCYPQQIPSPSLWNANTFGLPQRQLCIVPHSGEGSRSSSRCSESNESFDVKPTAYGRFSRYKISIANALVIVVLVCSLYFNAVYSGVLSLTKPG